MGMTTAVLSARVSAECGTAVDVYWSFRLFRLVCRRKDGGPLTPSMEAAFDRALQHFEQLPVAVPAPEPRVSGHIRPDRTPAPTKGLG